MQTINVLKDDKTGKFICENKRMNSKNTYADLKTLISVELKEYLKSHPNYDFIYQKLLRDIGSALLNGDTHTMLFTDDLKTGRMLERDLKALS